MVQKVLSRFVRIVEMNRSIIFMMVLDMLVVCEFVRNRAVISSQQRSPLHGKAVQWQTHQQEDTKDSSHRAFLEERKL